MNKVCVTTHNRRNRFWPVLFTIALLPMTLGQSATGGCGVTVTAPDAESDPTDTGSNPSTPGSNVDSDGDGFSDDLEINSTPGTDPNDSTDNPNNVRDSDGDGCSDFDELNFDGFCDNDLSTNFCETTYYNTDFGYGFDLPSGAVLENANYAPGFLLTSEWSLDTGAGGLGLFTNVQNIGDAWTLAGFADDRNQLIREDGGEFLIENTLDLSNGNEGYLSVWSYPGLGYTYEVMMIKDGLKFQVRAVVIITQLSEMTDLSASNFVTSLCVD